MSSHSINAGALAIWEEAEGAGLVHPGEEMAVGSREGQKEQI